jgi:hypothetical protein
MKVKIIHNLGEYVAEPLRDATIRWNEVRGYRAHTSAIATDGKVAHSSTRKTPMACEMRLPISNSSFYVLPRDVLNREGEEQARVERGSAIK